ncbi:hypothetical protein GCM10023094_12720 [Rhodococcus olei]|uniref:Uncharacterized protein n=1 Tax=Rhodococcus olei TaxID=2161675 RepID=A0ABP8NWY3_9NOCA
MPPRNSAVVPTCEGHLFEWTNTPGDEPWLLRLCSVELATVIFTKQHVVERVLEKVGSEFVRDLRSASHGRVGVVLNDDPAGSERYSWSRDAGDSSGRPFFAAVRRGAAITYVELRS